MRFVTEMLGIALVLLGAFLGGKEITKRWRSHSPKRKDK